MRTRGITLAGWLLIACTRSTPSVSSQPDAPTPVSVSPAPAVAPGPTPSAVLERSKPAPRSEHRVAGAIEGQFVPAASTFVVGEPIVVSFRVRPTSAPLRVFVGGDGRNAAGYPMRVAVKAVDVSSGATTCDNVESPPFPSFGGIGSEQVLAKGEWLRETFVLNPACPGLSRPGVHRVTLHRRITDLGMKVTKPGKAYPTSCDVHPLHEGPADVSGEPACEKLLDAAPSVTSVFELTITPFDAPALRRAVEQQLGSTSDEITRNSIAIWLCGWVGCACSTHDDPSDAVIVGALPAKLPKAFPGACP